MNRTATQPAPIDAPAPKTAIPPMGHSLRRRGLVAGAAALVAAAVAAQPIAAAMPLVGTNGTAIASDTGVADGVQGLRLRGG